MVVILVFLQVRLGLVAFQLCSEHFALGAFHCEVAGAAVQLGCQLAFLRNHEHRRCLPQILILQSTEVSDSFRIFGAGGDDRCGEVVNS